jgi:hypothetical protein
MRTDCRQRSYSTSCSRCARRATDHAVTTETELVSELQRFDGHRNHQIGRLQLDPQCDQSMDNTMIEVVLRDNEESWS